MQARIGRILSPEETFPVTLTRVVLAPPVHLVVQVKEPEPPSVVRAKYQAAPGVTVTIEIGSYWLASWEYDINVGLEEFWDTQFQKEEE